MKGYTSIHGFKIYYTSNRQSGKKGTLLGLHGGPGATLDYLKPLNDLSQFGYRVVLYNQLGSDKSDVPSDDSNFTIDYYTEECESIRSSLSLGKIHLLGHSWGGMLAIAYALRYQANLSSLIISSGLASVPLTEKETQKLVSSMPQEAQHILKKYAVEGDFDNPEYLETYDKYFRQAHSFRLKQKPKELDYTLKHINKRIFRIMEGPDDLNMTGNLKDWDVTEQLHSIKVPCLITVGKYDSVPLPVAQSIHEHIKGSKLVQFGNSAHFAMWEERERYIKVIRDFLEEI